MMSVGLLFFLFVITFLLGSIPWGVVISKVFYKKDIRDEGSGNIGTTNAMRAMGKVGGSAVFALDFLKGILSGWLGYFIWGGLLVGEFALPTAEMYAMFSGESSGTLTISEGAVRSLCASVSFLGCIWGHVFSPWLGFRGGKGIAVAIGCLFFTLGVIDSLIELGLFIVIVALTRYISLGSVAAAVLCPFLAFWTLWGNWASIILVTIGALTILWAHRGNISRLVQGCERKIGSQKQSEA